MIKHQPRGKQNLMRHRRKQTGCALAAMLLALGLPAAAHAQTDPDLTSKLLIAILVKKGVLSQSDANSIMQEAQSEASAAQAAATAPAAPPAPVAAVTVSSTTTPDGTIHVTYVPPVVRNQIAGTVEQEVLAQEQAQGYAAPNQIPDWVSRIHIYGDFRARYEADLFPSGNDPQITNFNSINTGNPFDVSGANVEFEPRNDSTEDRTRFLLRARIGVDADLGQGFSLGFRFATGQTDSPVSENQTIGNANNAQGGNFSKYAIWLDRAYLAYTPDLGPNLDLTLKVGRFDNPFFSTNLIWADDLGFDGAMATGTYKFDNGLTPFFTAGAFPVENTYFNFESSALPDTPTTYPSHDKSLFAAQTGASYKFTDDYAAKLAVADYLFTNVAGKLSAPCYVYTAADTCSTDDDRPSFAQNGNTYMALRDIIQTSLNGYGTTSQYQYFGLASGFDELALTGEFDISNFDPTHIWLNGEFVDNLAFSKTDINNKAVNNRASAPANAPAGTIEPFDGGNTAYFAYANIGQKILQQRWDWNAMIGYKYIESDAVLDAFNDSDFGLGGTNLKGYILGGNVALSKQVWVRLRYLSADSIAGGPYKSDLFQVDLNAKF
jgi:hypothetical protein